MIYDGSTNRRFDKRRDAKSGNLLKSLKKKRR